MTPKVSTISKKEFKVFAAMSRENKNKRSFVSLAVKFCQQKPWIQVFRVGLSCWLQIIRTNPLINFSNPNFFLLQNT